MKHEQKVAVPITVPYFAVFLVLIYLCMEAHETFHHLIGGILCGGFGLMTLTIYEPLPQCNMDLITLSGPFLSFAIAWLSAYFLLKKRAMLLSYTLIFASFAHLRFPLPLMGSGDEWSVVRDSLQTDQVLLTQYLLAGLLLLLSLPPLVIAYRSIANRQRLAVFAASWLLPLPLLYTLPLIDQRLFGPELNDINASVFGIPVIILGIDLVAIVFLILGRNQILHRNQQLEPWSEHSLGESVQ